MLQIYCKNNNSTREFPEGSSLLDIYNGFNLAMPYGPVSAKVNNKVESLDFRVYYNKDIEFLDITSSSGMRTYVRSLFFILVKAVEELYPKVVFRWNIPSQRDISANCILTVPSDWMMCSASNRKCRKSSRPIFPTHALKVTRRKWFVCSKNEG